MYSFSKSVSSLLNSKEEINSLLEIIGDYKNLIKTKQENYKTSNDLYESIIEGLRKHLNYLENQLGIKPNENK